MEDGEVADVEMDNKRGEKRTQEDMDEEEILSIKPPPVPTKKHKRHKHHKEEKRKKHKKKRSRSPKERNDIPPSREDREKSHESRGKDSTRTVKLSSAGRRNVEIRNIQRPRSRERELPRELKRNTHINPAKFDMRRLGPRPYNSNERENKPKSRHEPPPPPLREFSRDRGGYSSSHGDRSNRDGLSDNYRYSSDSRSGGMRRDRSAPMLIRRIDDNEEVDRKLGNTSGERYSSKESRSRRDDPDRRHNRSKTSHEVDHRVHRVPSPQIEPPVTESTTDNTAETNSDREVGSEESTQEEQVTSDEKTQSNDEKDESSEEEEEEEAGEVGEESSDKEEASSDDNDSSEESSEESGEEEEESEQEEIQADVGKIRSKFDSSPEEEEEGSDVEEDKEESSCSSQESGESGQSEEEPENIEPTPEPSPEIIKPDLPYYLPAVQGCRSVDEFQCLNRIEEGTYGVVYRARDKKTQEVVALKRLKMEKEREGFPITSLREVCTLLKAHHPNIVRVQEIVVGSNMDKIYIVMDYVEHDMKSLMETMKQPFLVGEIKTLMIQLLKGVHHLHDNWILHRDLKTSNLLLSHHGVLKIGDFGLAREYGSPLKPYTPIVVTLWYRSPELLLGCKEYSTYIDLWSVGCIFAEFLTLKPLFPGKSEIIQLNLIFKELGTPSEKIWPGYNELPIVKKATFANYTYNSLRKRFGTRISEKGFDLLNRFLTYCPSKRISAREALQHDWFSESPSPVDPTMFPTWPAKSEQSKTKKMGNSPKAPEGGAGYNKLLDKEDMMSGFQLTAPKHGISKQGMGFNLKF